MDDFISSIYKKCLLYGNYENYGENSSGLTQKNQGIYNHEGITERKKTLRNPGKTSAKARQTSRVYHYTLKMFLYDDILNTVKLFYVDQTIVGHQNEKSRKRSKT